MSLSRGLSILTIVLVLVIIFQPSSGQNPPFHGDKEMVCFVYHRFNDNRHPSTNISTSVFERQLAYLAENDFTVMALGDAVTWLKRSAGNNDKVVVLTIDDGYRSFYNHGFPLLKKYGFDATLFINTIHIGQKDYMTWEQLKEVSRAGIEIGCHSHKAEHFLNMSDQDMLHNFKADLKKYRAALKENLGIESDVYSYPFGEFNAQLELIVKNSGFRVACAQNSGVISSDSDLFSIPRYPMGGIYATLVGFMEKSNMHALPIKSEEPESTLFTKNPPELVLCLEPNTIDTDQLQCFIHGDKECIVMTDENDECQVVRIRSMRKLKRRRTLYTITAPRLDGKGWCWYSRLWINPEVEE